MDLTEVTKLTKVDDWEWTLYKVDYCKEEGGWIKLTRYLVSTPDHVEHEIFMLDDWPSSVYKWAEWEEVRRVDPPPHIGNIYGAPLSEGGWSYGRRLRDEELST